MLAIPWRLGLYHSVLCRGVDRIGLRGLKPPSPEMTKWGPLHSQRGEEGHASPNRQLSGFFLEKNWVCWDVGPALFSKVK